VREIVQLVLQRVTSFLNGLTKSDPWYKQVSLPIVVGPPVNSSSLGCLAQAATAGECGQEGRFLICGIFGKSELAIMRYSVPLGADSTSIVAAGSNFWCCSKPKISHSVGCAKVSCRCTFHFQ